MSFYAALRRSDAWIEAATRDTRSGQAEHEQRECAGERNARRCRRPGCRAPRRWCGHRNRDCRYREIRRQASGRWRSWQTDSVRPYTSLPAARRTRAASRKAKPVPGSTGTPRPSSLASIRSAGLPVPKKSETIGSKPPAAIKSPAAFVPPAYDQVRSVTSEGAASVKLNNSTSLSPARLPVKEKLAASADTLLVARTAAAMAALKNRFMNALLGKPRPRELLLRRGLAGTCAEEAATRELDPSLSKGKRARLLVLRLPVTDRRCAGHSFSSLEHRGLIAAQRDERMRRGIGTRFPPIWMRPSHAGAETRVRRIGEDPQLGLRMRIIIGNRMKRVSCPTRNILLILEVTAISRIESGSVSIGADTFGGRSTGAGASSAGIRPVAA